MSKVFFHVLLKVVSAGKSSWSHIIIWITTQERLCVCVFVNVSISCVHIHLIHTDRMRWPSIMCAHAEKASERVLRHRRATWWLLWSYSGLLTCWHFAANGKDPHNQKKCQWGGSFLLSIYCENVFKCVWKTSELLHSTHSHRFNVNVKFWLVQFEVFYNFTDVVFSGFWQNSFHSTFRSLLSWKFWIFWIFLSTSLNSF